MKQRATEQTAGQDQTIDQSQVQLDGQVGLGIDLVQIERMEQ